MFINDEKKFVFVSVPKTGSTAINMCAMDSWAHPEPHLHHASIKEILEKFPHCQDYFKFAFVRNPWDKVVSAYFNGIQDAGHIRQWSEGLHEYKNFEEFVMNMESSDWSEWTHFLPSSHFVKIDGQIAVDFVGRFENLEKDFQEVASTLGINGDLSKVIDPAGDLVKNTKADCPLIFRRSNRSKDYKAYYGDETKKIIESLYKEDIESFGYEF